MGHLRLSGVTKSFGAAQVIKPTDLEIEEGEFAVFVGPSGCGKSTMLRMIAGLEEITSGTIEIDGQVVNHLAPVKRGISMVFQSYALYPHMSVYENIAFPLRVARTAQAEVDRLVKQAADVLQLTPRLQHRPGELSGGQRQRVAIGRAIVREPKIFLFDEPLSNLDAALRADMRVELSRLHGQLGNTMIYVTHDQIEAMTMADKIIVLRDGVIAQVGSPLELFHKPRNQFVAGFIGNPNMNFMPASCTGVTDAGVTVSLPGGASVIVPVPGDGVSPGDALTLGIRPDDLTTEPGQVSLPLMPEVVERLGNQTVVYGTTEGAGSLSMIAGGSANIRPGTALTAYFAATDAHLFRADGTAFDRDVDVAALAALA
ncbi:sn-glycerol-3-phosphate ABC transporter ATP-binding protein UgpC [Yoonia sp. SS1-5]|uniref:ABC transporter ATP-binding protein n=1 Tax=Yoonia rhodophyticola TaxID=3137370 RepID=A0AAN0MGC7_9RHOB